MHHPSRYALLLLAAVLSLAAFAQSPPAGPGAFPEALLKGKSPFDAAIFYQGDLRGNFGPCG
jgi:hypothetical protein